MSMSLRGLARHGSRAAAAGAIAIGLLLAPAAPLARAGEKPPAFLPELEPFVGTWKRVTEGKDAPKLYLVIKEEDGRLRLRYQLPHRDKVYTSDWDGQIEVTLQVNVKEKHENRFRVAKDPPRIEVSEHVHYGGTFKSVPIDLEGVYEMDAEGRLLLRCTKVVRDGKALGCPPPVVYERLSKETRFPG